MKPFWTVGLLALVGACWWLGAPLLAVLLFAPGALIVGVAFDAGY